MNMGEVEKLLGSLSTDEINALIFLAKKEVNTRAIKTFGRENESQETRRS